jgi:hypothetical protein
MALQPALKLAPIPGVPEAVMKLEEYLSSPAFTTAIGDFMRRGAGNFTTFDVNGEQPPVQGEIYHKYQCLVEGSVDEFLAKEGLTPEDLFALLESCHASGASGSLLCFDYIIASTEYGHFLRLVSDFAAMGQWGTDEDTTPERGLRTGLEDDGGGFQGGGNGAIEGALQAGTLENAMDVESSLYSLSSSSSMNAPAEPKGGGGGSTGDNGTNVGIPQLSSKGGFSVDDRYTGSKGGFDISASSSSASSSSVSGSVPRRAQAKWSENDEGAAK